MSVKRIAAKAGSHTYDIVIGQPLSKFVTEFGRLAPRGTRVGILSDAAVSGRYGEALLRSLKKAGYEAHLYSVPSGERSKSLHQAEQIYSFCAGAKLERKSWLIGLGGGVT